MRLKTIWRRGKDNIIIIAYKSIEYFKKRQIPEFGSFENLRTVGLFIGTDLDNVSFIKTSVYESYTGSIAIVLNYITRKVT